MSSTRPFVPRAPRRAVRAMLAAGLVVSLAAGCSGGDGPDAAATASSDADAARSSSSSSGMFDASFVHDIEITFDQTAYDAMIAEFRSSGDKPWIEATVVLDGVTYERVGIRLKGNSSLMSLRNNNAAGGAAGGGRAGGPGGNASASTPNALPWLVRLDKYVDGQDHKGTTELVVRSNNSQTSLNEAVALEVLGLTGQPIQKAFATRFSVNGSAEKLRLVVENPGDEWDDANFENDGVLYKAESGGDYSYRGEDASAYKEVFDQETDTDTENFAPLTAFLKFINESDDATFARDLGNYLEIDAFATYLAGQELVANFDDIDGPGNNSYLRYDATTKRFTIVSWDLNLAFGSLGGGGFPGGTATGATGVAGGAVPGQPPTGNFQPPTDGRARQAPGGALPGGATAPGAAGAAQQPGGGFRGRSNILVTRFQANAEFTKLYDSALATMKADLYTGGSAGEALARWTALLTSQASDLVSAETVQQEAANISRYFTS